MNLDVSNPFSTKPNNKISICHCSTKPSTPCKHTSSPTWFSKFLKHFYLLTLKTATGKSKKIWVYGRHFWRKLFKSGASKMPAMKIISLLQRPNDGVAVSCLTATSSVPLSLAISHIPCNHCIKERTGSKPLQECFILRSELGRWRTYYAGQISKVLLPLVVLGREGYVSLPPVPAQAWKWLPVWVPAGGAAVVTGRQTHATVHTKRKA